MMHNVNQFLITVKLDVSSCACDWGYKALLGEDCV